MKQANSIQQAVDLSNLILTAIDEQDWDSVTSLDEKRIVLIEDYYKNTETIDAQLTRELKLKNDEIVSLLKDSQQQIRSDQIKLQHSHQAAKAYQSNS